MHQSLDLRSLSTKMVIFLVTILFICLKSIHLQCWTFLYTDLIKNLIKLSLKYLTPLDNASKNLQNYSDLGIPMKTRNQLHRLNYHDIDKYKLLAASFGLNFSLRSFVCSPNNNDQYHEKINLNLPPDDIVNYEKQYKEPVVEGTNHLLQQMKNKHTSQF